MMNKDTLKKRFESTAAHYKRTGSREWAYAKNGLGDEHYGKARKAYNKMKEYRNKAEEL